MVALLALAAALLPQTGVGSRTGVEGLVLDAETGAPVAYAQLRVLDSGVADWTDDQGRYRLEGLGGGEWRVRVVHPGHDSLLVAVVVPGDRDVRLDLLLEPRAGPSADALADFAPFQVAYTLPALLNAEEVQRTIARAYPDELVRRGIEGETVLNIWLDETGRVVRSRVSASSGQPVLDALALAVSDSMRFRPARSGQMPVRVIVRIPVQFRIPDLQPDPDRGGGGGA